MMYSNIDNGYDAFSLDNSYTMLSDKPGRDAQESIGASLRFDWGDIGNGSLTSITALAIPTSTSVSMQIGATTIAGRP